jgi:hypothetical protein
MGIAPDLDERTQRDCGWLAGTFLDIVVDFIYSNLYFPGLFVGWVFSFARCLDATQLMTACNNNMLSVYLLMWLSADGLGALDCRDLCRLRSVAECSFLLLLSCQGLFGGATGIEPG